MNPAKTLCLGVITAVALLGFKGFEPNTSREPLPMQAVECRWLTGQIDFDGVINEIAWKKAETIPLGVSWESRNSKTTTTVRLLWDEDYLYFCGEMEDNDLYADVQEQNGRVWNNDSIAMYFKPSDKKLALHEFQINAANSQLQLFLPSRGAGGYERFVGKCPIQIQSIIKHQGTLNDWTDKDKGWTVEGRIAWASFTPTGGRPKPGEYWRFALSRRDFSVTLEQPELSTNAPLTAPDMYRYEEYQELVFMPRK